MENNFASNSVVDCCVLFVIFVDCFGCVVDCVLFCCGGLADELGHAPHWVNDPNMQSSECKSMDSVIPRLFMIQWSFDILSGSSCI